MGSDAEVYIFDHDRYAHEVVPAVRRLLRTGDIDAIFMEALKGSIGSAVSDC